MKKNPAAVALGRIKSEKKAVASAANGALGGRPKIQPVMVEEVAIANRIYSQIWQRGKTFAHVVFYIREGQTRAGNYCAQGNTADAVLSVAGWVTGAKARKAHHRFCEARA